MKQQSSIIDTNIHAKESLRAALIRFGINPDSIKDFIDSNLESNRDISELKKSDSNKLEYCKEQIVLANVEILRIHLNEKLF